MNVFIRSRVNIFHLCQKSKNFNIKSYLELHEKKESYIWISKKHYFCNKKIHR